MLHNITSYKVLEMISLTVGRLNPGEITSVIDSYSISNLQSSKFKDFFFLNWLWWWVVAQHQQLHHQITWHLKNTSGLSQAEWFLYLFPSTVELYLVNGIKKVQSEWDKITEKQTACFLCTLKASIIWDVNDTTLRVVMLPSNTSHHIFVSEMISFWDEKFVTNF